MTKPLVNKEAVRMDLYADSLQTDKIGSKLKLTAFLGDYKWVWDVEQSKLWGLSNQKRVNVCVDAFRYEFGILGVEVDPTFCDDCKLYMQFQCMSGTEDVWFEEWKCLKCMQTIQIEVTPKG